MANDDRCVFCGKTVSSFRSTNVLCGKTYQLSCKDCAKELEPLDHTERCRRALQRGLAYRPEQLRSYIEIVSTAEDRRPKCPSCGGRIHFMRERLLDSSPFTDGLLSSAFSILPACCTDCGRYEFYNPDIVRKNPFLEHLLLKDTDT